MEEQQQHEQEEEQHHEQQQPQYQAPTSYMKTLNNLLGMVNVLESEFEMVLAEAAKKNNNNFNNIINNNACTCNCTSCNNNKNIVTYKLKDYNQNDLNQQISYFQFKDKKFHKVIIGNDEFKLSSFDVTDYIDIGFLPAIPFIHIIHNNNNNLADVLFIITYNDDDGIFIAYRMNNVDISSKTKHYNQRNLIRYDWHCIT
jgi:hypothetical protein